MISAWTLSLLWTAASWAAARQDGPVVIAPQDDPVDRQVQRMKDQLQLTDEQVSKIKDILKSANEKIKGTLTDEQKPKFDEMNNGRNMWRGGGGGRMMMGPGMIPPAESLKEPLGLSDDQVKKIDAILQDIRSSIRDYFQNGGDRQGAQEFMQKTRDEGVKRVKELLTEDQKAKLDKLLADQGFGPPKGPGLEERVKRAMEALKIEKPDEASTIKDDIVAVLKAQEKLDTAQREMRSKVDEISKNQDLSEEAIGDRLKDLRANISTIEKELRAAQKALREIVTNRQELELIRHGVLR